MEIMLALVCILLLSCRSMYMYMCMCLDIHLTTGAWFSNSYCMITIKLTLYSRHDFIVIRKQEAGGPWEHLFMHS